MVALWAQRKQLNRPESWTVCAYKNSENFLTVMGIGKHKNTGTSGETRRNESREVTSKNKAVTQSNKATIRNKDDCKIYKKSFSNKEKNRMNSDSRNKINSKKENRHNSEKDSTDKAQRSKPKYEYCLDLADENEKELILNGTTNDRLSCLALLCARSPTDQNYKQLLQFCENQRNDVIYVTLKLVRDLIKENKEVSPYIKSRIIKSFDMGAKNQYIKDKVIEIIGVLARADIFTEDFINILVSRLLEKGKVLVAVEEALKSLFSSNSDLIFEGIEDFYYKNDTFRCQLNVLKFLRPLESLALSKIKDFFRFYDSALSGLDENYAQDQQDIMIELLVNGLSRTVSEGDTVSKIELIRGYVRSSRTVVSVLNLLMKTGDAHVENYVLRVSRTTLLRSTKHEPEFLNMIYKLENRNLFSKLVDGSFYCSVQMILALLLMAYEKGVDVGTMFSLRVLNGHFNPVVRDTARKLLRGEKIAVFDPFDAVYLERVGSLYTN